MNKISCNVIKDLLPLYVDDICSENSKELVEKHLLECEECKKHFELLQKDLPEFENTNQDDVAFLNGMKKKIQKKLMINRLAVALTCVMSMIFILAAFLIGGADRYDFAFLDKRLAVNDIQITEIYELENGDIYFTIECDKKVSWPLMNTFTYDNYRGDETEFYSTASLMYSWWDEYVEKMPNFYSCSYVCPQKIWSINEYDQEQLREISSICFEGKGNKQEVIWMNIMSLEKAPESVEQKVNEKREGIDDYLGFAIPNYE